MQVDERGWALSGVRCHRLPWIETDPTLVSALSAVLAAEVESGDLPVDATRLGDALQGAARERVRAALGSLHISSLRPSSIRIELHVVVRQLSAGVGSELASVGRLHVVPVEHAVRAAAEDIQDGAVVWDWKGGGISLTPRAVRLRMPQNAVVRRVDVVDSHGAVRARRDTAEGLKADESERLELPPLALRDLFGFASDSADESWHLDVHLEGRTAPVRTPIPPPLVGGLPAAARHAEVSIHAGSHSVRVLTRTFAATRDAQPEEHWEWMSTADWATACARWGPQPPDWGRTEREMAAWLAGSLPAIAGRTLDGARAWLRDVRLCVPGTDRVASSVQASPGLQAAARAHLVGGQISCVSEADAALARFRPVIAAVADRVVQDHQAQQQVIDRAAKKLLVWKSAEQRRANPVLRHLVAGPTERPPDPPPYRPVFGVPQRVAAALAVRGVAEGIRVVDWGSRGVDVIAPTRPSGVVCRRVDAMQGHDVETATVAREALSIGSRQGVVVVTGGGAAATRCERLQAELDAAGAAQCVVVSPQMLAAWARAVADAPEPLGPELQRLLELDALSGAVPGRYDLLDGMLR